jgi:NADH-quinone oxidoreductase subunit J
VVAQNIVFGMLAIATVGAGVRVVTTKNVVHAALWLVVVLAAVGGSFLLLGAEFVGITQILVYIGAIVVLFLFGIMLTRAPIGKMTGLTGSGSLMALLVAVALAGVLGAVLIDFFGDTQLPEDTRVVFVTDEIADLADAAGVTIAEVSVGGRQALADGINENTSGDEREELLAQLDDVPGDELVVTGSNTAAVGDSIFAEYLVPFEVVGLLLTAALIGAIALARKE